MAQRRIEPSPYRLGPARPEDLDEIVAIERESFLVPWKREFFASEILEPFRYARVRNRGLGRELLEDALGRARSIGASSVTLEVRISNLPARQFYRSYGFHEAYRRKAPPAGKGFGTLGDLLRAKLQEQEQEQSEE